MVKASRIARTFLAAGAMAAVLAACSAVENKGELVDRAMSALARGDTANAENFAVTALRKDPKDPYALLVAGLAYQGMGRYDLARQYYQVILTNRPQVTLMVPGENGVMQPRPVIDVARANIGVIDKITGRSVPRTSAQSGRAPGDMIDLPPANDAEDNIQGRFRILKRLLADNLVTPEEYAARRNANIGGLLPYSSPAPAVGLARPVPPEAQVVDRLRQIASAVEHREMSPGQAAAERAVILDALLPAAPEIKAIPPVPPKDVLAEATLVGRLERMRSEGLVSADEAGREKAAMDRALGGPATAANASGLQYGAQSGAAAAPTSLAASVAAPHWGVALAWSKSEASARASWERVKAKFPEQLGGKDSLAKKIQQHNGRTRWRVVAGPFDSQASATEMCKTLKLHRQACDLTIFAP